MLPIISTTPFSIAGERLAKRKQFIIVSTMLVSFCGTMIIIASKTKIYKVEIMNVLAMVARGTDVVGFLIWLPTENITSNPK